MSGRKFYQDMIQRIVPPKHYDLVTIGGGSSGAYCAIKARSLGKTACIIDKHGVLGKSIYSGYIPKKIIHDAHMIYNDARRYCGKYGIMFEQQKFDWIKLKKTRESYVEKVYLELKKNCKDMGVDILRGQGRFKNDKEVEVASKDLVTSLTAEHIVIATGSRPYIPNNIQGINECLDINMFFEIERLPRSILIMGSDSIGIELACILNSFGVETSIITNEKRVLPTFDSEIVTHLSRYMKENRIAIYENRRLSLIHRVSSTLIRVVGLGRTSGELMSGFEAVLCADGGTPNIEDVGLDNVDVELDERGYIMVDEDNNTTASNVYAIGQVTGMGELASFGRCAGESLASRLFGKETPKNVAFIPNIVFSDPPIGKIGISEAQAKNRYGKDNIGIYIKEFTQLFDGVTANKRKTYMKMIYKKPEETVLGVHALGRGIDKILQGFAAAMTVGIKRKDLENVLATHPATSETFIELN